MSAEQKPPAPSAASSGGSASGASTPGGSTSAAVKVSTVVGIVAAMVLAVIVNLYVARHYKRWDVTRGGLYTLSDPTLQTLHSLEEPVQIYVLLPSGAPLTVSVSHLLEAYKAETTRIDVKQTDPDRRPAEFLAIQRKYGVNVGQSEDGRILSDAAIIVARNDKPYFITESELVAVDDEEDTRIRPRLEESLTTAIRTVTSGKRPKVCFATGHGEKPIDAGGGAGLAALKDRLSKNNYDTLEIAPARAGEKEELQGCDLLVLAGPSVPVPAEDVGRFVGFVKSGGSLLVAVNPEIDERRNAVDLGLAELFSVIGLKLDTDFVFELDPKRQDPNGFGEVFMPEVKPHAITEGLLKAADRGVGVTMNMASSLSKQPGEAAPSPLLVTTDKSFGLVGFAAWAKNPTQPAPGEADQKGPLTVAWAVELPKKLGSQAARGARAVAMGSSSLLVSTNWQTPDLYGNHIFVENAISWLVSRPSLVSIPKKPSVAAGLRVSEEDLKRLGLFTILCMPIATMLFGLAVFLLRRSGERRGRKRSDLEKDVSFTAAAPRKKKAPTPKQKGPPNKKKRGEDEA